MILAAIFSFLKPKTQQQREEEYYAQATDLVDLERRINYVKRYGLDGERDTLHVRYIYG